MKLRLFVACWAERMNWLLFFTMGRVCVSADCANDGEHQCVHQSYVWNCEGDLYEWGTMGREQGSCVASNKNMLRNDLFFFKRKVQIGS